MIQTWQNFCKYYWRRTCSC